jgi:hypothetical protein
MKYTVYHAVNPTFGFGEKPNFPEDYKKVAVVETNHLEEVFRITNHIDHDWTDNPEVVGLIVTTRTPRSTSVGDVVVDEDGVAHYCAGCGWETLSN